MNKKLIEFGKRMDSAQDKETFISFCEGAKHVLDLGSGTGKMAREIAKKFGCKVDAVDKSYERRIDTDGNVTYYGMSIEDFVRRNEGLKEYDRIIFSAVLHELNDNQLKFISHLSGIMAQDCRILIREPFYDFDLGPISKSKREVFCDLIYSHVEKKKSSEYFNAKKLSSSIKEHPIVNADDFFSSVRLADLAFVLSYGEDSWKREKHEYRYARSLDWCKHTFNSFRSYTGFQVYPVLDTTYREHFINAGIPGEAFDMIQYTGMHVIIDYSKGE